MTNGAGTIPTTPEAVQLQIVDGGDKVVLRLIDPAGRVPPINIPMDPQAAFDAGEIMARMAHKVRFGEHVKSDQDYLAEQIRSRTTEQYRHFLVNRIKLMFNSLREDKKWSNQRLAEQVVDTVVTKFA